MQRIVSFWLWMVCIACQLRPKIHYLPFLECRNYLRFLHTFFLRRLFFIPQDKEPQSTRALGNYFTTLQSLIAAHCALIVFGEKSTYCAFIKLGIFGGFPQFFGLFSQIFSSIFPVFMPIWSIFQIFYYLVNYGLDIPEKITLCIYSILSIY